MFIDLSGFTAMTEALMRHGDEGAEIMSGILNRIFNPIVNHVYRSGGFISTFAGDAFTAIFPKKEVRPFDVLVCAKKIQAALKRFGRQQTRFGEFVIKGKIGISFGQVEWGIAGSEHKAYFFRGEAVDCCAKAEHCAEINDIIYDSAVQTQCPSKYLTAQSLPDGFFRLKTVEALTKIKPIKKPQAGRLRRTVAAQFFPEAVIGFAQQGEFRNVATVFISFAGITAKAELDALVSIAINQTETYGGYFNKIDFGDKGGVMVVVFGAPVAYENNTDRALDFILALCHEVADAARLKSLKLRAGITYGLAYAGFIGGLKRCEYTVIADVVNLAARFMAKAEFGQIWTSESIAKNAGSVFQFEPLGAFAFKGKSDNIPAYSLTGKQIRATQAFGGKLVGRSEELQQIAQAFAPLPAGKFGGIVYVYGEPGVGKSRLVYELKQQHADYLWLYLPCDGIQRKPFNPFLHCFRGLFNQDPEQNQAANREQFERVYQHLTQQMSDETQREELKRLQPFLAEFLGIVYEDSLFSQLDAKLRYDNTLYAIKETLKSVCALRPLILELEDLQWIDADSREAFKVLCRNIGDISLLIVCTSRYLDDESKPTLPIEGPTLAIDLNSLSEAGMTELAETLLNGPISPELRQNLKQKTEGNPFFVEQTLLYYREFGIIANADEVWRIVKDEAVIPSSINDLLISRIDRLSEKLKEAVQTASVLGSEFDIQLLQKVLGQISKSWKTAEVRTQLKEAEGVQVWSILSELRGIFAHALMHDVVYHMQLRSRLRLIHRTIAQIIEKLFEDDKKVYADLAYHYERAEETAKAIDYLHKAGDYARENYHNQAALDYFDRLLTLLQKQINMPLNDLTVEQVTADNHPLIEIFVDASLKRGNVSQTVGKVEQARQHLEIARKLAETLGDEDRITRANGEMGKWFYFQGKYPEAMACYQKQLEISKRLDIQKQIALALDNIGIINVLRNETNNAIASFNEELSISQKLDYTFGVCQAICNMGQAYLSSGDFSRASEKYEELIRISKQAGNINFSSLGIGNLGIVHYHHGDYTKAIECFEEKLRLSYETGNMNEISAAVGNLGVMYAEIGDYDKALRSHQRKLFLSQELGNRGGIALAYGNIANTLKAMGTYTDARNYYEQAIVILRDLKSNYHLVEFLIESADLETRQQSWQIAIQLLEEGLSLAEQTKRNDYILKSQLLREKIDFIKGDRNSALQNIIAMTGTVKSLSVLSDIYYELWQMTGKAEYADKAKETYRQLFIETPKAEYKRRLQELEKSL